MLNSHKGGFQAIMLIAVCLLPALRGEPAVDEDVYVRSFDSAYLAGHLRIPAGEGKHPALMFIHGGVGGFGMELVNKAVNGYVQSHFYADGYAVFQMDYRRFDFGDVELEDIVAGYRYLQSHPRIDSDRIGVVGGSHGGYLALMLSTRVKPAATVSFAGLTDLTAILYERVSEAAREKREDPLWRERRHHDGRSLWEETLMIEEGEEIPAFQHGRGDNEVELDLATRWGDDRSVFDQYSPIHQAEYMNGPILYLVGGEDRLRTYGKELVEKLRSLGHEATYSEYAGMPHAFYWGIRPDPDGNLPTAFYLSLKETADFLRQWVKNKHE